MTHYEAILHELAVHGRTTYAKLAARYPEEQGYNRQGFAAALHKLRQQGIVTPHGGKGMPIVAAGKCPCCGRVLG